MRPFTPKDAPVSPAERQSLARLDPGHWVDRPDVWRAGVVFASPHSGRIYPRPFREASCLSTAQLRRNEDMFVDRLFSGAVAAGAPLLRARFPRCYVDVNRAPDELPQGWSDVPIRETPRAQAGIGVVPTHIGERAPIYRQEPSRADAAARLKRLYYPYHNALSMLIAEAQTHFGQALLIDCHSMPGFAPMGSRRPDIVLGDRFGRSCNAETIFVLRDAFQAEGFSVALNYPYAGGYVTEHYGKPEDGIEVIQVEINRDLYLNPVTLAPKRGYEGVAAKVGRIVRCIVDGRRPHALAAQ
ncbi:N-formylglutamate amidohydrolase [uncultured Algimonas sp.]|uniref:N-formylglutamate amidohydrolase n=1 Tax=uncultured Algimonas sp. TaxID=1547920 RepID=UPI002620D166|nr:N-formylglutamate amidohydrolase [uncultured Algimonas sp.]